MAEDGHEHDTSDGGQDRRPRAGAAHLGVSAAVVALLFVILRLLAVTHYEWDVAFALSDSINFGDSLGVLIGTFLGETRWSMTLLAFLLPLLAAGHLRRLRSGQWFIGHTLALIVLGCVFVAAVITFRAWPALIVLAVMSALQLLLRRTRLGLEVIRKLSARTGLLTMAAVLLMAGGSDTMWVPKERIELRHGQHELTGYVVSDTGAFVKVLTEDERRIEILSDDDIAKRTETED
ncbi:hypothetical protein ACFQLX_13630 [Streptomyces polyrhachis]|uniref:Uncharacterized protein n=1 Tax=Streptomyces polyrhachis TaxID=1282885 RepID=A0ABW2GGI2_9ACTN